MAKYIIIWLALLVLTAVTVSVASLHLGNWSLLVALVVAGIKATLVALFFMHLWEQRRVYRFVLISSTMFVVILMAFVLTDVHTRYIPARPQPPVVGAVQELEAPATMHATDHQQSGGPAHKK